MARLQDEGVALHAVLARALSERGVATLAGQTAWTHTTVTRVLARSGA